MMPDSSTTAPVTTTAPAAAGAVRCRLSVTGMDCADCAKTLEASLSELPGVSSATVSFSRATADVTYDPERIDRAVLLDRVRSLGYDVQEPPTQPWLFDVMGMDCADCARTVASAVRRLHGVEDATVSFSAATLSVTPADDRLTEGAVVEAVAQAGYLARPRSAAAVADAVPWWRHRRVLQAAVAALLWIVGFALERTGAPRLVSAVPFLVAMVIAGYPVARAGWFALRARRADMNLLMTIAALGAIAIGEWSEGSSVLILFTIGLMLQTLTVERTRRAIQALVRLAPAEATVRRDGSEQRVPVAEVSVGEIVIVRPGERVPVDGVVVVGRSTVDQAAITGESIPVEIEPGATVFAGSINGDGVLEVRVSKPAGDTTLARIIHLVEEAQASKAPAQAFVDRFASVYTPIVVVVAILVATVVPLWAGDYRTWIFRALILLVVACPCALVISTPVALVAAIGSASRRGVLFKGGAAIEALATVRAVAFDKTGTLTAGRPVVTDVIPLGSRSALEVLTRAAAVEQMVAHPIARGVVAAARERGQALPPVTAAEGIPGLGARARIGDELVTVGSPRLFPGLSDHVQQTLEKIERAGKTAVVVAGARGVEGVIAVADTVRPMSARTVAMLDRLGLRTIMLTGDNRITADRIAAQVGVTDVRAELLPEDKVAAVADLQRTMPVAMVGDGVNDAPALATATVGIAMGVAGSDVAIEAADVALMGDDLAQVPAAVRLARRTMAVIRQNIVTSLLVKAAFLALTFAGVTNLWLAVLADMGTSLLVTFNALRLLRVPALRAGAHGSGSPILASRPVGDD